MNSSSRFTMKLFNIIWAVFLLILAGGITAYLLDLDPAGILAMGIVIFPLRMLDVRTYAEEDTCDYCSAPIYKGEVYFGDDYHMFCTIECAQDYTRFQQSGVQQPEVIQL